MEQTGGVQFQSISSEKEGMELLNKLVGMAHPDSVFSKPISIDNYTLITTSEYGAGLGFGFGMGSGPVNSQGQPESSPQAAQAAIPADQMTASGGGGGGGGFSMGRPVAVISVGPDGVRVEPVVDATKIGLAAISMLVSMAFALTRMRRRSRR
jgi:uncharacterized spore protein YtfJ